MLVQCHFHQKSTLPITIFEMWDIWRHSGPFSNWQRCSSEGHSQTFRWESESGSLSFVKYWSLGHLWIFKISRLVRWWRPASVKDWSSGQSMIHNFTREVSFWSPLLSRDLRFGSFTILREVREEGSRHSLGNNSASSHPPRIVNSVREVNFANPSPSGTRVGCSQKFEVHVGWKANPLHETTLLDNPLNAVAAEMNVWRNWKSHGTSSWQRAVGCIQD